ncbi:four helix bundle protein [Bacteroides sp. 224]|uniref:four helix bundle protein n=1 Tax=Bacteroides sp. 224 TaxID=2302936 RepID=UPI0013D2338B|nr:four helix bundle protein [Bacteroides sp. 224]NDV66575.1 four helix bundle protein [Bacteroides sp. 224]
MKQDNVVVEKSKRFAIRIINLYKYLEDEKYEFVMSKQILRSGTSIGANIREAANAQSKKDFLSKMYISLKETGETQYWLELLVETDFISQKQFDSLHPECEELLKLLTSITKSTCQSIQNSKLEIKN